MGGLPLLFLLCLPALGLVLTTSIDDIREGLTHPSFFGAFTLSAKTTMLSLCLIVCFGTPLAWWLAATKHRARQVVTTLLDIPIILPPAVVGLGLLQLFGRQGLWGDTLYVWGLNIPFTTTAVVLAQVVIASPYFIHATTAAFRKVNPDLLLVAQTLGRSPWYNFRRILVPLSLPGLVGGGALAWARALGEFGATLLFAGNLVDVTQTMPLAVYMTLESNPNVAVALALVLTATSIAVLLLIRLLPKHLDESTIGQPSNGSRP